MCGAGQSVGQGNVWGRAMCGAERGVLWGAVAHSTVCAVGRCVSEHGVGQGNVWKLCGCECEGGAAACGSREQLCVHSGAVCALMVSRRCVTLGGCDCCVCNGCVCV